tara:strand:+ start:554 stop:1975 length:1422 start_codon:yes stop_codon:yes gene_type:complete
MSLNFLQKSLSKLADTQASYKAYKGTGFNRYMDSIISTTGEVAKVNLEITNAAYNAFLQSTGQPITQEIKDRKKYAKNLTDKNIKLDPNFGFEANSSLINQIETDNQEAKQLIRIQKNPFKNKQAKLDASARLQEIKNQFVKYRQDKEVITDLHKNAIEAQKNPDPDPTLLEQTVHTDLLDGTFKDKIVWNPEIGDSKRLGGFYKAPNGDLIRLEDLKSVNKVDLNFESSLAGFAAEASQLARTGKWNADSRREIISKMVELANANSKALRPVIFNGFTADRTTGEAESYANLFLDKMIADRGLKLSDEQKDVMRDQLKTEDLTESFISYYANLIDETAANSMVADKVNKNTGSKFTASELNQYNAFIESYNLPDGSEINIPFSTTTAKRLPSGKYQIVEKGNDITLQNQKKYIISEEELLSNSRLPESLRNKLKRRKARKAGDESKSNTETATPTNMSPDDFKEFFQTKLRG